MNDAPPPIAVAADIGKRRMNEKAPPEASPPSGYRHLLGYRVAAWSENYAEIVLDMGPQHFNGLKIMHGGVYASMLDAAQGHAVCFCPIPENTRNCVTITLTTSYISSARAGRVRAIGRCIGISGRVATTQAEMFDEQGTLLATAQASFLYMPGSEKLEGVPRTLSVAG